MINSRLRSGSRDSEPQGELLGLNGLYCGQFVNVHIDLRLTHPARNESKLPTHPWVMHLHRYSILSSLCQLPTAERMTHMTCEHHSHLWLCALHLPDINHEFNTRPWVIGTPVPPNLFKQLVPNLQLEQLSLLEQDFGPIRMQSDMRWVACSSALRSALF